jgi:catechol 2,3-dioxygenase-like lactoylglutathione lyase family enzyme
MIGPMTLLKGFQHVAILTGDADRLHEFYREVFDAKVDHVKEEAPGMQLSFIDLGGGADLNVFQFADNTEHEKQSPMFGRGRIDHLGLNAESVDAFDEIRRRLVERGASDGFVTDFGPVLSVFFRDPDGLEGEVCVPNPAAQPGVYNAPGTPAPGYDR